VGIVASDNAFEQIWTEKYRPFTLDDVVGQGEIVKRLRAFVKNKSLQNLLFAGPAGTGKTTCAIAIARGLFGDEWHSNMLELNASDERGINVVRNKVKDFARTRAIGNVPYKLIYLDESDALTREAQQALRRTMEDYTHTCRFILACNYNSKIIDPIQSRCALFRFAPLLEKEVEDRLKEIAKKEKVDAKDSGLKAIIEISRGDLRTAINLLQSASASAESVDEEVVYKVVVKARPKDVEECVKLALGGDFAKAKQKMDDLMIGQGLAGEDVIKQIHRILFKLDIPEEKLVQLIDKTGEYAFRVVEGSDDRIQLDALLAQICLVGKNK